MFTRAMFDAQVVSASVVFDSLRAINKDIMAVYARITDVVHAVDTDEMTLSVGYREVTKVIEDMMRMADTGSVEKKGFRLPSMPSLPTMGSVKAKVGGAKDVACAAARSAGSKSVEICWDGTKRGLTTTGKAVVGVAVAGTVGAVGWGIKSLLS